jgi:hypothetical protein
MTQGAGTGAGGLAGELRLAEGTGATESLTFPDAGVWLDPVTGAVCADSVTRVDRPMEGRVLVTGSHGGLFAAFAAARLWLSACIFNDASVGLDRAGIAGLEYLDQIGMPAAAVAATSARIGVAADTMASGVVSFVNRTAEPLGWRPGAGVLELLARPVPPLSWRGPAPGQTEARHLVLPARSREGERAVWALDSVSLVEAGDGEAVVVTGSHGALLGDRPETAVKHTVHAALFNDAGGGADMRGCSRLPVLDGMSIAAATVDAFSARIGDGRSTLESGRISRVNGVARAAGCSPGMTARQAVELLRKEVG